MLDLKTLLHPKNYYMFIIVIIVVYGTRFVNLTSYIDSPIAKFSIALLTLYVSNINPLYGVYVLLLYFFAYNFTITKDIKESFSHIEAFENLEVIDSDIY